jgi:peroxiredoxin
MLYHRLRWAMLVIALSAALNAQALASPALIFTTMEGQKIRLSDLRGKIVLIHFWATSCGICLAEMPDLIQTYQQYHKQGFEVIAVAMRYDQPGDIKAYVRKQSLQFPVVFDRDGSLAREFEQVSVTPTTFLIDGSGRRVSKTVGIIDFSKLRAFLESAGVAARYGK